MKTIPGYVKLFITVALISSVAYFFHNGKSCNKWVDQTEVVCPPEKPSRPYNELLPVDYIALTKGINRFVLIINMPDGYKTSPNFPTALHPELLAQTVGKWIYASRVVHNIEVNQRGLIPPLLVIAREPKDSEIKDPAALLINITIKTNKPNSGVVSVRGHRSDPKSLGPGWDEEISYTAPENELERVGRFIGQQLLGPEHTGGEY